MHLSKDIEAMREQLIRSRRDFHRYPEPGWLEYRTASIVAEELHRLGFRVYVGKKACKSDARFGVPDEEVLEKAEQRSIEEGASAYWVEQMRRGHTAVVGVIKGRHSGPVVALRFDMDSNGLTENMSDDHKPAVEGFRSCHDQSMHACGHDGHTAIGLGVAKIISKHRDKLCGEVRLLFQPAEEGCRGAKSMVDAGWLDHVDYFFSGHIGLKSRKTGEVVASTGGFLSTTKINATFTGRPSHAGERPQEGKNALLAACMASIALNGIPRHSGGATHINVGVIRGGSGRNVIPQEAYMELETRGMTTLLNEYMKQEAIRKIEHAAQMYDVHCDWEVVGEATGAESSKELIPLITQELETIDSVHEVIPYKEIGVSEDVVYMLNKVQQGGGKASYLLLGSALKAGHHEDAFDFDEEVLVIGVEVYARLIFATRHWVEQLHEK